jgi:hypothetical protein
VIPSGAQIVDLLSKHPIFGLLLPAIAKKIWRRLAHDVYVALNTYDVSELIEAGVPWDIAESIANEWKRYTREIAVTQWLHDVPLSGAARTRAYRIVPYLAHLDLSNPYHAHPLLPWKVIDARPDSGLPEYAQERLLSACESVFLVGGRLRSDSLDEKALLERITGRLNDAAAARLALASATKLKRLVELETPVGRRFVNRGIATIMGALALRLRNQSMCKVDTSGRGTTSCSLVIEETDLMSECVATAILFRKYPTGRHIVPCLSHTQDVADQQSLVGSLRESSADNFDGDHVIVHRAHALDLLTLNKLIHLFPTSKALILAGKSYGVHASHEHQPFRAIAQCGKFPVVRPSRPVKTDSPPRNGEFSDQIAFVAAAHSENSNLTCEIVSCENEIEELLAQYRIAIDSGNAVIISDDTDRIAELNTRLQNELIDELSEDEGEPDSVRIHGNAAATIHTPVTWVYRDLTCSRLPGVMGKLSDVVARPPYVLKGSYPVSTPASAEFPDDQRVQLSKADLADLQPAFALNLESASLGSWSTVVLDCQAGVNIDRNWLRSASSLASGRVVFVRSAFVSAAGAEDRSLVSPDPFFLSLLTMEARDGT